MVQKKSGFMVPKIAKMFLIYSWVGCLNARVMVLILVPLLVKEKERCNKREWEFFFWYFGYFNGWCDDICWKKLSLSWFRPNFWVNPNYWNGWTMCVIGSSLRVNNWSVFTYSKRIRGEWKIIYQSSTIDMKKKMGKDKKSYVVWLRIF